MTEKSTEKKIDPLQRVFVPIEKRTEHGTLVFRTQDREVYARLEDGSIRRATPKLRGKAARRADKLARRRPKMKIQTTRGLIDESELQKKEFQDGDVHVVEYYLGGELVHRSATTELKGAEMGAETTNFAE